MTDQHISRIIEIIGSVLLVSLGAMLAPYFSNRIEKKKAKRNLKPNLRSSLYLLSRYKRMILEATNKERFYSIATNVLHNKLRLSTTVDIERTELERQHNLHDKFTSTVAADQIEQFSRAIKCQAELIELLSQIENYYSKEICSKLNDLLIPYIDRGLVIYLFDYPKYFNENITIPAIEFNEKLHDEIKEMTTEFNTVIRKVNEIF